MKKEKITSDDFKVMDARFQQGLEVARALDAETEIPHSVIIKGFKFDSFLDTLTPKRMQLLRLAKKKARSIAELATASHRDRSAVSKDIAKLAAIGLVTVIEEINAGHGVKKIVRPVAKNIEIQASL
jgi:predicted transcriptional regulator